MNQPLPAAEADKDLSALLACGADRDALRDWLQGQTERDAIAFDAGAPVETLVRRRAQRIDWLLQHLWSALGLQAQAEIALLAVGGYGRGELHPQSDVDILLLLKKAPDAVLGKQLEQLITLLWDLKLTVGHAVRTIDECEAAARDDLTIMTNLMEARLLCGDMGLSARLRDHLSPVQMWPPDAFFRGKVDEQKARHKKFEGTAYKLEPNLKSSPGGLRDIQNIQWIAKRRFGDQSLLAMTRRGIFLPQEYRALTRCQLFLWRVRYALHLVAGRAEDRLLFDLQKAVAERLGFIDQPGKLAVEQFMKQYFRAVLTVRNLNDVLVELFSEVMLGTHQKSEPELIDGHFQQRDGLLELRELDSFAKHPETLLSVFVVLAETPGLTGLSATTLRLLRHSRPRVNAAFRADPRHQQLFIRILRARANLAVALFALKNTGILGAFVPAFAQITGQMQFDRFHHYTVDEHTLFLLRNLVRLSDPQTAGLFPHAERIMQRLVQPELIYLAGLFHDIGKGRGGDHSELGAVDALAFCKQIGLSDADAELVSWLVQSHLAMSLVAQRKDITDPDVIAEFAAKVGTVQRLELLYVLTMCDIRATNASLWNGWKDALLRDLYLATKEYLRRGSALLPADVEALVRDEALQKLAERGIASEPVHDLWRLLGGDYFAKVNGETLAWVTEQLLAQPDDSDEPLVAARQLPAAGGTEFLVYVHDQEFLFAAITALLAQKRVSIQAATIHTTPYGMGLDAFVVLEEDGQPVLDLKRLQSIQRHLQQHLRDVSKVPLNLQQSSSKRQPFVLETRIAFSNDARRQRTALELITLDRPGLLARIGAAFKYCDLLLHNAKIITLGERAEDVFFITDRESRPLTAEKQQQLEHMLRLLLDSGDGKTGSTHSSKPFSSTPQKVTAT